MKKLLFILAVALSFTTVKAQVDPVFTAKFANLVNVSKDYCLASEIDKPAKSDLVADALAAFRPITNAQFSSKLNSMFNSSTEMSKVAGPLGFALCVGSGAATYVHCWNNLTFNSAGEPIWPNYNACHNALISAIAQCAITHL